MKTQIAMTLTSCVLVAVSAFGSWYENPVVKSSVDVGFSNTDPQFLAKSADEAYLAVPLNYNIYAPVKVWRISELVSKPRFAAECSIHSQDMNGLQTSGTPTGCAISSDFLIPGAGNGTPTGKTVSLKLEQGGWQLVRTAWTQEFGVQFNSLVFASTTGRLYSNDYTSGSRNKIHTWGYANLDVNYGIAEIGTAFADTGVDRIRSLSLATIGGNDIIYYGEGTKNVATSGKVFAIDTTVSPWSAQVVVDTGLSNEEISCVKLSGTKSGTPVLYVLTDSGVMKVYALNADGLDGATLVKTFDAAQLSQLSGLSSAPSTGKFRNFEVTDDGAYAFFMYGNNGGDCYNPDGKTMFTVVANSTTVEHYFLKESNTASYAGTGAWKDGSGVPATQPPHKGADYTVLSGGQLRVTASGTASFAGDALVVGSVSEQGTMMYKDVSAGTVLDIADLRLVNASLTTSWSTSDDWCALAGSATVGALSITLDNGRTLDVRSALSSTTDSLIEVGTYSNNRGTLKLAGDNANWRGRVKTIPGNSGKYANILVATTASFGGLADSAQPSAFELQGGELTLANGFGSVKSTQRGITASGNMNLNVPSGEALYDGTLTGAGTISRTGSGKLTFAGAWTGAKVSLTAGTTVLANGLTADASSSLSVASAATLTLASDTENVSFGGTLAFGSGAAITLPASAARSGRVGKLTVGGLTVADRVTLNFSAVPADADELPVISFPASEALDSSKFALGANKGSFSVVDVRSAGDVKTVYVCTAIREKFHLGADDGGGASSINDKSNWRDANNNPATSDPYPGADYLVADGHWLRTPQVTSGAYEFQGNSLTLGDGSSEGQMMLKHEMNASLQIGKMTLKKGQIYAGGNTPGSVQTLKGSYAVKSGVDSPVRLTGGNNITMRMEGSLAGEEDAVLDASELEAVAASGKYAKFNFSGDNANWFGTVRVTSPRVVIYIENSDAFGGVSDVAMPKAWHFTSSATGVAELPRLELGSSFTESVAATKRGIWFDVPAELSIPSDVTYDGSLYSSAKITKIGSGALTLGGAVDLAGLSLTAGTVAIGAGSVNLGVCSVASGTTLVAATPGVVTTIDGDISIADGACLEVATSEAGGIAGFSFAGMVAAAGTIRISFSDLNGCIKNPGETPILTFPSSSQVADAKFVFDTAGGSKVPVVESYQVRSNGDGTSSLVANLSAYVLAMQDVSYVLNADHWSNGKQALDSTLNYLCQNRSLRENQGMGLDYTGKSYTIAVPGKTYSASDAQRRFFLAKYTYNNISTMRFYGTCGIIPGQGNGDSGAGLPANHQLIRPLLDDSSIVIENEGGEAFYIDPNNCQLDISVPLKGSGRFIIEPASKPSANLNGVNLEADNSAWIGTLMVKGWQNADYPTTLLVGGEENLGGNPETFDAAALCITQTAVFRPTASFSIDDENRGVTLANGGKIDVGDGLSLTLGVPFKVWGTTSKDGLGTLELDGESSGESAPVLKVNGGALGVANGNAISAYDVVFADGASLVIREMGADKDEESLVEYGALNLRNNGIQITGATLSLVLDDSALERKRAREVPLLTVLPGVAETIEPKLVFSNSTKKILATLKKRQVTIASTVCTQFYAECKNNSGIIMIVR